MKLNGIFKKPKNELEKQGRIPKPGEVSDEMERSFDLEREPMRTCPKCKAEMTFTALRNRMNICNCGHHYRTAARERLAYLVDRNSFNEFLGDLESRDILGFEGYERKLKAAKVASDEKDAVVCGTAKINGKKCALFIMESNFMMGSMGTVVGEKITRTFEYATEHRLPVVGFTTSGGARMQEGILSLMQMAKTSGAVKRHSDAGLFYLTVLTDPTTGGVTASFAMEGDIIMSEPGATIGFAGARVIEQTIRKKLPEEFQTAEFLLEHGFIDLIAPRPEQRGLISQLLAVHSGQMVFASDAVDNKDTEYAHIRKKGGYENLAEKDEISVWMEWSAEEYESENLSAEEGIHDKSEEGNHPRGSDKLAGRAKGLKKLPGRPAKKGGVVHEQ